MLYPTWPDRQRTIFYLWLNYSLETDLEDEAAEDKETEDDTELVAAPKPKGRSVAEIQVSVKESLFLDKTHLDNDVVCEDCHGELPASNEVPEKPTTETCLSCHEKTYSALALLT
ncbi:MAG: hypothetical protein DRP87_08175 [Spirochaetes bacterium]|nr:MAG: hypothetical protein DRP87_08175 [Spirochaetota bacterium]